jgi:hypothetical protein
MADPEKREPLVKPEAKPEAKSKAKSKAKPETKPEPLVKPEEKPEPLVKPEAKPEPLVKPEVKAKKSSPEEKLRRLEDAWEEVDLIAFCTEGGPQRHPADEDNPIVRAQEQEGGKPPRYSCKKHWDEKVAEAKGIAKDVIPGYVPKTGRFKTAIGQMERPAAWSETHKSRKKSYEEIFRQAFVKKPGDEETKVKPDGTLGTAIRWWEALQDAKEEEFEKIKQTDPSAALKDYPHLDDLINIAQKFVKHFDEVQRNEEEAEKYESEQIASMKSKGKYTNPTYAEWMDAQGRLTGLVRVGTSLHTPKELKKMQRKQDFEREKQQKIAAQGKARRTHVTIPSTSAGYRVAPEKSPELAKVQADSKFVSSLDKALLEVANA